MKTWHQYACTDTEGAYQTLATSLWRGWTVWNGPSPRVVRHRNLSFLVLSKLPGNIPLRDRTKVELEMSVSWGLCTLLSFSSTCVKATGRRGHISTYLCITHTSQVQLHAAAMISYNEIPSIGGAILLVLCNTRQGLFHHSNNL